MEERILNALAEMNQKFDKKFDEMHKEMHKEIDNLRQEVNQNMNHLAQKILDRQFVFEDEYGRKIDAIFEYVEFHQKNNLQRFDRISNLEDRVETTELQILDHEKRISALERKKV